MNKDRSSITLTVYSHSTIFHPLLVYFTACTTRSANRDVCVLANYYTPPKTTKCGLAGKQMLTMENMDWDMDTPSRAILAAKQGHCMLILGQAGTGIHLDVKLSQL